MHSLSFVVLNAFQGVRDYDGTGPAEINRQAFLELEKWAIACEGRPRRWDQYQEWPGRVFPKFVDLVAVGDDTALLVLIHWTAVMSRSSKPFIHAWAVRAGLSTVDRLEGNWDEQLAWPLAAFAQPLAAENAGRLDTNPTTHLPVPSYTGPDQTPALFPPIWGDSRGFSIVHDAATGMPTYRYPPSM